MSPAIPQSSGLGKRIPVTIITGFLGSGKTTLLNQILKEKGERNIAVIENEFGEVNIDSNLVSEELIEKEDLVSLENGCICCSLRKDIVNALAEIERRSRMRAKPVDAVIIETTGLADPAPVAFTFFTNPWIASRYKLDSIICVVDSKHLVQHLDDERPATVVNEAAQQIAFADLILLNKTDLLTPNELADVEDRIKTINMSSRIIHCQLNRSTPNSRPPLSMLLDTHSFSVQKACSVDPNFLDSDSEASCASDEEESLPNERAASNSQACSMNGLEGPAALAADLRQKGPRRKHKKMHDLSGIGSVGIVAPGPLDEYRFNMFMRDLLAEKSKDILRCKGVLQIQGYGNTKFVFQGVHETLKYGPAEQPWRDDEPKLNKVVFIGHNLDRKAMIEGFRSCVWVPLPNGWQELMDPVSKRPYYYHAATKQKTWMRPEFACPRVVATQVVSTGQPMSMLPRKNSGQSQA